MLLVDILRRNVERDPERIALVVDGEEIAEAKEVIFVNELAKSVIGKVLKNDLRARCTETAS